MDAPRLPTSTIRQDAHEIVCWSIGARIIDGVLVTFIDVTKLIDAEPISALSPRRREKDQALGGTADFTCGAQGLTVKISIPGTAPMDHPPGPADKS
jgi:hypothetical protein